jgi:hypothetical protein
METFQPANLLSCLTSKIPKTFISLTILSRGILVDFILGKIGCFTSNKINGFIDKTPKTFTFSIPLSPEILMDFTLGKIVHFTTYDAIEKKT